jgi:O-antigen/teichoic acid export membrane protein
MAANILTALLAVVVLRTATGHLGPHRYGQLVTVITFVTISSVVTDLGLNGVTIRNLAKAPDMAPEIIGDNLTARVALCLLAIPIMGATAYLIYPTERGSVALGVVIMSVDVLFSAVSTTSLIFYSARTRLEVNALILVLDKVLYTVGVIVVASVGASLFGYIAATLLADGTTAVLSLLLVRRQVRLRLRIAPRAWRRNLAGSVSLGIMQVVGTIFLWVDSFLISLYLGPKEVAFYGIAFALLVTINSLSGNFMGSLLPALSRSSADELPDLLRRAFYVMVTLALPIAVGGILLRVQIIEAIAGTRYLPSAFPLAVLLASIVFTFLNNVYGYACIATNRVRLLMYVQIPAVALNVVLNLLGIPRYGIDAAAFATLIAEVVSFVATALAFRADVQVSMPIRRLWRPVLASAAMIGVSLAGRSLWHTESALVNVVASVAVLGAAYVLVLGALKGVPEDIANLGTDLWHMPFRMVRQSGRER